MLRDQRINRDAVLGDQRFCFVDLVAASAAGWSAWFDVPFATGFREEPNITIESLLATSRNTETLDRATEDVLDALTEEWQTQKAITDPTGVSGGTLYRALETLKDTGRAEQQGPRKGWRRVAKTGAVEGGPIAKSIEAT